MTGFRGADLTGKRYGKLLVRGRASASLWDCLCDCGKSALQRTNALASGHARSCGCMQRKTHGMHGVRTYKSWDSMKQRCTNPNAPDYDRYGGRGIVVCERWLNSFDAFFADMGERPEGKSLERKDNARGYEPDNCKWATAGEQQRNKRNCPTVDIDGVSVSIASLAVQHGLPIAALKWRLSQGWTIQRALDTPKFLRKGK